MKTSQILLTLASLCISLLYGSVSFGHGTSISPMSRVYRVYLSNPENPNFPLAAEAVATDGTQSYYSWNELSRNISEAVHAALPPGFDYSPWVLDGQLASGGRVDPGSPDYPRTYAGLDQVSADWPTTEVAAGSTLPVDFLATAPHDPSVWDVWMTTPDWEPSMALNWAQMEFLDRPTPDLIEGHYRFDVEIPANRVGHHVLWIAWQRDDPVGEVFFSTSDLFVQSDNASTPTLPDREITRVTSFPDPFDTETIIGFSVPMDGLTTVSIHDAQGVLVREVLHRRLTAGEHSSAWDGTDTRGESVASGVYFARVSHATGSGVTRLLRLQ